MIGSGGIVIGTATCGNRGAQFSQSDVYSGRYDVELVEQKYKKKWWQFWK